MSAGARALRFARYYRRFAMFAGLCLVGQAIYGNLGRLGLAVYLCVVLFLLFPVCAFICGARAESDTPDNPPDDEPYGDWPQVPPTLNSSLTGRGMDHGEANRL